MNFKKLFQRMPQRSPHGPAYALSEKAMQETLLKLSKSQEQSCVLQGLLTEILKTYQRAENLSALMSRTQQVLKHESADCPSPPSGEEGFMCATDFDCELGSARGGVPVYSSLKDLREHRGCVEQCGIARVRVVLMEWVQRPDFSALFSQATRQRVALDERKP